LIKYTIPIDAKKLVLFYCMHKSSNASLLYSPIATTAGNTLKDQLEQLEVFTPTSRPAYSITRR